MRGMLFALLLALTAPDAKPFVVDRAEVRQLVSKENGVAYKVYVALPQDYGKKRYPVVYVLDADYSFLIARNVIEHLAERNHLRELIVVGIAYDGPPQYRLNRTRDYTPKFSPTGGYGPDYQKVSGGGPKFRAFLEKELIPFVDRSYATLPEERCLVGHSYGGLFATWMLVSKAALFDRYVIVSPSLWYDDAWIFRQIPSATLNARVYMAAGSSEDPVMAADLRRLAARIRTRALDADVLAAETHNSIFPRALSNGLRFVFEGR
jgi:predicted alpha/beta superfamily hydrolase